MEYDWYLFVGLTGSSSSLLNVRSMTSDFLLEADRGACADVGVDASREEAGGVRPNKDGGVCTVSFLMFVRR